MARSKGRSSGGGKRRSSTSKASSAPVAVAEIEVVEEEGGMGIDDGIVLMTTLMLLAAFLFVDYTRGKHYGEGLLFKDKYEVPDGFSGGPAAPGAATAPAE